MKPTGPTNPITRKLIANLEKQSRKEKIAIWSDVAERLSKSSRRFPAINLGKLERFCKDGETVIIPGKLLAEGAISKKITVSAFKSSATVKKKIEASGGKVLTIPELLKRNPKGSNIRIMG